VRSRSPSGMTNKEKGMTNQRDAVGVGGNVAAAKAKRFKAVLEPLGSGANAGLVGPGDLSSG